MKGLKLTRRGELVRDIGIAVFGAPAAYALILLSIYVLEGMGL